MKSLLHSGNRLTKQRQFILETVRAACFHPTADQIYELAKKKLPRISVGTVYRNLDFLVEHDFIKRINIPEEPVRFDGDICKHVHFICREKGGIYDLPVNADKIKQLFQEEDIIDKIDDVQIIIYGTSKSNVAERMRRKGRLRNLKS